MLLLNLGYLAYNLLLVPRQDAGSPQPFSQSVPKVKLLGERPSGNAADEALVKVYRGLPKEAGNEAPPCSALGPFSSIKLARDLGEHAAALGLPATVVARDQVAGDSDFRVLLPPAPSVQEAFRKLRELKKRKIDSYVITDGEDARSISLGVFSTEEAALDHQTDIKDRGYNAKVKQIPRITRTYWLIGQQGTSFPESRMQALRSGDIEFAVESLPCTTGA